MTHLLHLFNQPITTWDDYPIIGRMLAFPTMHSKVCVAVHSRAANIRHLPSGPLTVLTRELRRKARKDGLAYFPQDSRSLSKSEHGWFCPDSGAKPWLRGRKPQHHSSGPARAAAARIDQTLPQAFAPIHMKMSMIRGFFFLLGYCPRA